MHEGPNTHPGLQDNNLKAERVELLRRRQTSNASTDHYHVAILFLGQRLEDMGSESFKGWLKVKCY